MKHETLEEAGLSYAPCRYGTSRSLFRGPKRPLDGKYIAFVGGTETYGRFIADPFPALVEETVGDVCVNLGMINASVDAYTNEPSLIEICRESSLNIVQVMGAQNMSNRFYTVHPRRNDRFLRASTVLQAVYPDVDFSDFCFTRHMLRTLYARSPDRFEIIRMELEAAWQGRMVSFLSEIGKHTFLLWFAGHLPSDGRWDSRTNAFNTDPLFVSRRMIDSLRPLVRGVVMAQPSARALGMGTDGMIFSPQQSVAAAECLGVAAHQEAAKALVTAMRASHG